MKSLRVLALSATLASAALAALPASAQTAAPAGDAQKLALAQKIATLSKLEGLVLQRMVQAPALNAVEQSRIALQGRVPEDKQKETMKAIANDVQDWVEQVTPTVREAALKDTQVTIVPMLVKNFSVEELQQIVAILESPVRLKFEAMVPDMTRALGNKVAADIGAQMNPKLTALTEKVGTKMRNAAGQ